MKEGKGIMRTQEKYFTPLHTSTTLTIHYFFLQKWTQHMITRLHLKRVTDKANCALDCAKRHLDKTACNFLEIASTTLGLLK